MKAHMNSSSRRGSILGTAMLFFVVVTVAGTAILSMSTIQRLKTVRNGIDVRLMIAAEAGIETARGRFTLIPVVQESWSPWLNNSTWTTIETLTVNGVPVTVQARLFGGESVPTARVRSTATASNKSRTVEYMVKVSSFSDYAVFTNASASPGQHYKLVGNMFTAGNIPISAEGVQFFGSTRATGTITKSGVAAGVPDTYTFPNRNPEPLYSPAPPFPNAPEQWDVLRSRAETTGFVYAENTLEIIFTGETFTRTYVRRTANGTGNGTTVPIGRTWRDTDVDTWKGWVRPTDGATNFTHSYVHETGPGANYVVVTETGIPIPDEGVIYIRSGAARDAQTSQPDKDALGGNRNNFRQVVTGNIIAASNDLIFKCRTIGDAYSPIILLSGRIHNRRISIVSDNKVVVKQPIVYHTLLHDASLRRFYNDPGHVTGKQSQTALGFKEMLGVMCQRDIHPCVTWWSNLTSIYGMGGVTFDAVTPEFINSPHYPDDTYCMDGVYLSLGDISPRRHTNAREGEMWFHGGLIGQLGYGSGNANHFQRRQYDWDYRMNLTMPPYFLNTFYTSATFIPGTWRTWEN